MKVAIMQPYFLPYLGYWQLFSAVDKFIIYDDVNYINKGWINRNRVLVNNSTHTFTIPLLAASQNKLIKDIEIENNQKWKTKLLRTIELNYKGAKFFKRVFPLIESIIYHDEKNISSFILNSIREILGYLEVDADLIESSTIYNNSALKGAARIIDICNNEGANIYVNPLSGKELYDRDSFLDQGIQLQFLKPILEPYKQFSQNFIPGLSIIDVLMFRSEHELKYDLQNFVLE